MKIETLAVHAGHGIDPATGAVIPPIHLSTTFERDPDGSYPHGYVYTRRSNPNRDALESALAGLEGAAGAAMFSSGMAAATAIFNTLAPGDHVLLADDVYYGVRSLLGDTFAKWGIDSSYAQMSEISRVEEALRPETKIVWIETPSNPLLTVTDIAAAAELAHRRGALLVCDSTFATPILQRPLEHGADLVLHATTKYIGGHGDVLGGAVLAREPGEILERIRTTQHASGAVPSPFECWLTLRSLRTLHLRMKTHSESALAVATALVGHPAVERVHYPGLTTHPGHETAKRQMKGFGGMLSIQIAGDAGRALEIAARTRLFTRATSLGGVESLIEHRASIEGPGTRTPENLLRLSIGLEHPDDLIEDLFSALEHMEAQ